MRNSVIIIPALDPPAQLKEYVKTLKDEGFMHIILVDDGSREESRSLFDDLRDNMGCDVITHASNMGKGRALKDALNHYLNNYRDDHCGVITVDSDGQHTVEDVIKLDEELGRSGDSLILGARDFSSPDVPFKSRFGNRITKHVIKFLIGGNITDTQTGLRGIPNKLAYKYLTLYGERFEYETMVLIETIRLKCPIKEIPIKTVYFDNNSETHFNAFHDSVSIYKLILKSFFKYVFVSISSFALDYGFFCLISAALYGVDDKISVWSATISARVLSSLYNYFMNKNFVFSFKNGNKWTIVKYYLLCIAQMCASALLVLTFTRALSLPSAVIKPVVDLALFFISFQLQKNVVFSISKDDSES